jgi:hypothetical protein
MGFHSPRLILFDFDGWVSYLLSFNPSKLSSLLAGYARWINGISNKVDD